MTRMMPALFASVFLLTASACTNASAAPDPIDGTWKADLASVQIDEQPSVYLLKDGVYSCSTCVPALSVQADGAFHAVADQPYYDSLSVKVVDDRTVTSVRKKGDRVVGEATMAVSPDGNTLTITFSDSTRPDAPPVTGKGTETRVAAAPANAHALSGSWKTAKYDSISDEGLTVSYRVEGETLQMNSPSGESYTAKLDGTDAAVKGDIAGTLVSVQRLAPDTLRETFKREGKPVGISTMTMGKDGKMSVVYEDKVQNSTMKYTALKQ